MNVELKTVKVEIVGTTAILKMDNPPVNQLSAGFREDLKIAFEAVFESEDVKAVILTGTGKNFMAGGDISELSRAVDKESMIGPVLEFDGFLSFIELGPKPVIAAVNGPAMGGGLELAMACHYRIAGDKIRVGQPEVQLGLIPGAGGTQRLPRLCGVESAVKIITTGRPLKAGEALDLGILDLVVPGKNLLDKAIDLAGKFASGSMNHTDYITSMRIDKLPSNGQRQALFENIKGAVAKNSKGLEAPLKAVEAMEKGLSNNFGKDMRIEAEIFSECAVSSQARNLMGIFINTRTAGKLERIKEIKPGKVNQVAMLGFGVMGAGIVHLLLKFGYRAVVWDVSDKALEKGEKMLRRTFAFQVKKGKMSQEDLDKIIEKQLTATTELSDIAGSDLVIEAVIENMGVKGELWKKVEEICGKDTVFASNTSALSITELGAVLSDPGRMLGLHFFNPAERMQLVEVITGKQTDSLSLATAIAFSRKIAKVPVVVNDGPGFYTSRQLNALMGECNFMLEEGIPMETVDRALVAFGMPMGAFTLHDLTGIDIGFHVASYFEKTFGDRWKVSEIHKKIFETGCFGRKTGAGYYDYSDPKNRTPSPNPVVKELVGSYLEDKGDIRNQDASPEKLAERMLARAINEAAYMMEEGICDDRPRDMDLAMVYGCGYPAHRGGVFRDADGWGIGNVYSYLTELEKDYGDRFKPAGLLKKMADSGQTFYSLGEHSA